MTPSLRCQAGSKLEADDKCFDLLQEKLLIYFDFLVILYRDTALVAITDDTKINEHAGLNSVVLCKTHKCLVMQFIFFHLILD